MEGILVFVVGLVAVTGGVASGITLAFILLGFYRSDARRPGAQNGPGARFLRWPVLAAATVAWIGIGVVLWLPLPFVLGVRGRWTALILGGVPPFGGLALYWWGIRTLGEMFGAASGFGVRLCAAHRLVTSGPYGIVRHPMYVGVILAFIGALLVYRTWACAVYALMFVGLPIRAAREERALSAQFGDRWEEYRQRVPGWFPRLRPRRGV